MSVNLAVLPPLYRGESDTAQFLGTTVAKVVGGLKNSPSYTVGFRNAFAQLNEIAEDCAHEDWDGYGARPVDPRSAGFARLFLRFLDLGMPEPEVGAEPDGCITLDWFHEDKQTLTISVDAEGVLHYAALFGGVRVHGTARLVDEMPPFISDLIRRSTQ